MRRPSESDILPTKIELPDDGEGGGILFYATGVSISLRVLSQRFF